MKSLVQEFKVDGSIENVDPESEIVRLSVPVKITSRDNRWIVILADDSGESTPVYPGLCHRDLRRKADILNTEKQDNSSV